MCRPCLVGASQAVSSKRLDTIADYTRHGYALRVDCRACRHMAVLNPLEVTWVDEADGGCRTAAEVLAV